jgi:hypothetical protein
MFVDCWSAAFGDGVDSDGSFDFVICAANPAFSPNDCRR